MWHCWHICKINIIQETYVEYNQIKASVKTRGSAWINSMHFIIYAFTLRGQKMSKFKENKIIYCTNIMKRKLEESYLGHTETTSLHHHIYAKFYSNYLVEERSCLVGMQVLRLQGKAEKQRTPSVNMVVTSGGLGEKGNQREILRLLERLPVFSLT